MSPNPGSFRFHGGLHVPDHKRESLGAEIQSAGLAAELVVRASQHIGEPNKVLVETGDRVTRGQKIAHSNEAVSAPVHAPASGKVVAVEARPIPHPSGQEDLCIIIQPDDTEAGTGQGSSVTPTERDELIDCIREAGIVGLGGAVFPTAAKLQKACEHNIKTLIINGAECEPYITCDHMLMQCYPEKVLRGIEILQQILQPAQTLIGIEDNKPSAISALQQALARQSLVNTQVITIPTRYPSGGEKQLIKILTGDEVRSGQLAFEIGYIAQNVGTCVAIADAVDEGQPLTTRVVTVTGPGVRQPGNWAVPLGTPIAHLIELAGGYSIANPLLIMGGPMMGLPLAGDHIPVVKATNCVLVLDHDQQPRESECVRCGQCAEVCPAQLLPQQLYWFSRAHQFDRAEQFHLFDCIECGCCSAVCPSHIPLVQHYRFAKSEIWEQRRNTYKSDRSRLRHEFREARIARQKAEEEERRRLKREALAKKKAADQAADGAKPTPSKAGAADAVQAALERVKARKNQQDAQKKNTENLTPEQQRQIDEANARRAKLNNGEKE